MCGVRHNLFARDLNILEFVPGIGYERVESLCALAVGISAFGIGAA